MMNVKRILINKLKHYSISELTHELGLSSPAFISNIISGKRKRSPTLEAAMIEKGWLDPPKKRCRISADVTPDERKALHKLAEPYGGWSQFCRYLIRRR